MCKRSDRAGGTVYRGMYPVTSFGVCVRREVGGEARYLVVQRRDSMAYAEFVRGRYDIEDEEYVMKLVDGMTVAERGQLRSAAGQSGGGDMLWGGSAPRCGRNAYRAGRRSFDALMATRPGAVMRYIDNTAGRDAPEWGLPKGRKAFCSESGIECALRELREETGIDGGQLALLGNGAVREFVGGNRLFYRHVFYNADLVDQDATLRLDSGEISDARWLTVDEIESLAPELVAVIETIRRSPGGGLRPGLVHKDRGRSGIEPGHLGRLGRLGVAHLPAHNPPVYYNRRSGSNHLALQAAPPPYRLNR